MATITTEHGTKVRTQTNSPYVLIVEGDKGAYVAKRSANLTTLRTALRRAGGVVSRYGAKTTVVNGKIVVLNPEDVVVTHRGIYEVATSRKMV